MAIALLALLIGIYLFIGIRGKRYTMRTRLLLLGVSTALPAWFYLLM